MNLTIERTDLLAALTRVAGIVPRSAVTPILSNVLLTVDGGGLTVRATNMDIEATARASAVVSAEGAITVPGAQFTALAKNLPNGADVDLALEGERLTVKSGRSRFELPTLAADQFPVMPDDDWTSEFTMSGATLADMINRTGWAAATGKLAIARASLACVNVEIAEGALRMAGACGPVVFSIKVAAPDEAADIESASIPLELATQIAALAAGAGDVRVSLSDGKARVQVGDATITGKLLGEAYVPFNQFIAGLGEPPQRLKLGRENLRSAIRRVTSIAAERAIIVEAAKDFATVSTRSGAGEGSDDVSAESTVAERFGFNPQFLADALANLRGETVTCAFTDSKSPTIWTGEESDVFAVIAGQRVAADA